MVNREMREAENYTSTQADNWVINVQEVNGEKITFLSFLRHTVKFCVDENDRPASEVRAVTEALATFSLDEELARNLSKGLTHYLDNFQR